jgi:hypothetical protein
VTRALDLSLPPVAVAFCDVAAISVLRREIELSKNASRHID